MLFIWTKKLFKALKIIQKIKIILKNRFYGKKRQL